MRMQIFVGDVAGAFGGRGLGHFHDLHKLTMFADYRVPVVLRQLRVLSYSTALAKQVRKYSHILHTVLLPTQAV